MDQKNILVVGGGIKQLPLIRHAVSEGCRVVVLDRDPAAPGFELASDRILASTRDVDAAAQAAIKFNETTELSAVVTMASESAVTVATIAAKLGLPGADPGAAWRATHKLDRQRCFKEHDVPAPRYAEAREYETARELSEEMGWPVVVKPVDSAGSRGVQKVNDTDELRAAVEEIRHYSARPEFVLEEFLTGTEHSVEGLVMNGQVYWTAFSDRNYDKKEKYAPYFLEDGDSMPSSLSKDVVNWVLEVSTQAVRALGITWGPAKGDILIDEDGPKVIEMAARLSGDYFCDVTTPLHNGVNIMEILFDMSLGRDIDPSRLSPKFNRGVALRYIWPESGRVCDIKGLEEVRKWPGIEFVEFEPAYHDLRIGDTIKRPSSMGERVASVMAHAHTREEAVELAERAVRSIVIETIN